MVRRVLIGIQARSTSSRLPGKALALIAGDSMLDRVVGACLSSARYLERYGVEPLVAVLVPHGDEIVGKYRKVPVHTGPEHDVLQRYAGAADALSADLIVRITGDCPLIPSFVISRITSLAIEKAYDYISNVDERFRTTLDGCDCEVISRRLLDDTAKRATEPADREHVTTMIRRDPPEWAQIGVVLNHFDLSWIKLSVDTEDDLARVRKAAESAQTKHQQAAMTFGKNSVHTI